ncbi:MAG TPA: NAD(P)/FAD-dependent oxidoreductase [Candidatus Fimivicinus intestinavium]|nr:NAD(P)/FAD-dependent oxidoreductase [Candidatus Fimivicinus intestinavium]
MVYDVVVIGAGVTGALIARELSRYELKVALLEKNNDAATETSKANSAIVHAGYDAKEGTLKAKLNVHGAKMMGSLCEDLSVPFQNIGSLVLAFSDEEMETLQVLLERGQKNGVPKLEIISQARLHEMEPNVSKRARGALWAPTASIVCPYELTIAAVENAVVNGVAFYRNCEVERIVPQKDTFSIGTPQGAFYASYIVNAAGVHADEVAEMIGDRSFRITPRRGEYLVMDKNMGSLVSHVIFQCPTKMGKGVLVSPTVDGNLLAGPNAVDVEDKYDTSTTVKGLQDVQEYVRYSIPTMKMNDVITSFAGLRAHGDQGDFIIGPSERNSRFIHVAGIESPGLTASPATAEFVVDILREQGLALRERPEFTPVRKGPVRFHLLTRTQQRELIAKDPAYGHIVCRCETVTEGEIRDAIRAPAGARDVDGVKRRTRAGMGRCQGGFCGAKVVEILSRELGLPEDEITKFGGKSNIVYEKTK